jgi:hypothetical protein
MLVEFDLAGHVARNRSGQCADVSQTCWRREGRDGVVSIGAGILHVASYQE